VQAAPVVTFNNNLDGQGTFHNIQVFDNPDSANDSVVIESDVSNPGGLGFPGNGRVLFDGNITGNTGVLGTGPGNVVVVFNGDQLGPASEDVKVEARGESMLFINGTVDVGDDVQFENNDGGPALGGSGRINLFGGSDSTFELAPSSHLRPGPDVNATGTLTVDLMADSTGFEASVFEVQPDSTYHMEFAQEDGSVVHDSVAVVNENGLGFIDAFLALENQGATGWNLQLSALESLSGLIFDTDEFDLFTLTADVKLLDFDTDSFTIDDAPILSGSGDITSATILPSTDFDTSAAVVKYDIGSGRVYVTGITYTGPSAAGNAATVPEPTAALLMVFAATTVARLRRRHAG
jgi:hypothetical protein